MTWFSRLAFVSLWVFVFTIPSEKAIEVPGFGTLSKLAGFVAIGFGLLAVLMERRVRLPAGFHKAMVLFGLWCGLTLTWTVARDVSVGLEFTYFRLNTLLQLFAMVLLIWQFTGTENLTHSLLYAYVLGTLVPAANTAYNFLAGHMSLYYERYSLANTEPNDLALALALSLPMSYYLILRGKGILRILCVAQMLAACVTVLLTASRAGSIATLAALSIVVWTARELTPTLRAGVIVAAGLLIAAALVFVPLTSWKRLATSGSAITEGTLNSRTVIWKGGWENFEQSPFLGIGAGAYPDGMEHLFGHTKTSENFTPVAHNTFLSVLVETGVIGFSLFAAMLATLVAYVSRLSSPARQMWFTVLAVWTTGVMALTWEDRKPTWLIFSLIAAHQAAGLSMPIPVARREARRTNRPEFRGWEETISSCR